MKATDELRKEHEGIKLMLQVLHTVADKFKRDEDVDTGDMEGILEFLSIFVDKCHHGKEEVFLFPALENAGVPNKGGPIGVMLYEHEQGRKLVARLKEAMTVYRSGGSKNASGANLIIDEYVSLLTQHIAKENNVLFPMADSKLGSKKDDELFEAFDQLEKERIGIGKHDEFHVLLNRLKDTYLA